MFGYAVGLDMTHRDLQNAAKKQQRWPDKSERQHRLSNNRSKPNASYFGVTFHVGLYTNKVLSSIVFSYYRLSTKLILRKETIKYWGGYVHPFVEKILLLHKLGRRISEAGDPGQPTPTLESVDDLAIQELLHRADCISAAIIKREHLNADDEKAILAAAFLALRRRTKEPGRGSPGTFKSSFLFV